MHASVRSQAGVPLSSRSRDPSSPSSPLASAAAGAAPDHAAQAWNVLPPGQAGGVAFTKNSTDQIALYEGLTRCGDRVTDADLRRFFKRETLGLGQESAVRSSGRGKGLHDHARPLGRAARQGRQRTGRRLRSGLGDRRRPAADHGAAPRPGPDRGARRARRRCVRARALRADRSGRARRRRRCSRGSSTCFARGARGDAGRSGSSTPTSRGSTRSTARRACPLRPGRGTDVVAVGGADRRRLRRGRRRRGAAVAVPRAPATEARRGAGPPRLGGPAPAATTPRRAWPWTGVLDGPEARSEIGNVVVDPGSTTAMASLGLAPTGYRDRACRMRLLVGARRSATGQAALRRRPAGRPLLPWAPAGARPRGRRLQGAGRRVPGHLVRDPPRSRDRLRVERDLRRVGSRRRVRRDALRGKRHAVPAPGRVPADDDLRRRDDRRSRSRIV